MPFNCLSIIHSKAPRGAPRPQNRPKKGPQKRPVFGAQERPENGPPKRAIPEAKARLHARVRATQPPRNCFNARRAPPWAPRIVPTAARYAASFLFIGGLPTTFTRGARMLPAAALLGEEVMPTTRAGRATSCEPEEHHGRGMQGGPPAPLKSPTQTAQETTQPPPTSTHPAPRTDSSAARQARQARGSLAKERLQR